MPCPKFTPLQARFAASLGATLFLACLYLLLFNPQFAYAIDVDSIIREDHNHPILLDLDIPFGVEGLGAPEHTRTAPHDDVFGNDVLTKRAPEGMAALANNEPKLKNIDLGELQHWVIPKEVMTGKKSPSTSGPPKMLKQEEKVPEISRFPIADEDKKRDAGFSRRATTVYVTVNTCLQPQLNDTRRADDSAPPQLRLYYSEDKSIQDPGPNTRNVKSIEFDDGYASAKFNVDDDIYIGIYAPIHPRYSGIYNYEVAASIDAPFHSVELETPSLYFVDSGSKEALLQTQEFSKDGIDDESSQKMMENPPPYTMFAHNMNHSAILGIQKSYCGLKNMAQIRHVGDSGGNVRAKMTDKGRKLREQIYVTGLNRSSSYYGILALKGNSTASGNGVLGGGGKVWKTMNFTTKTGDNCAILHDLDFCSEVAYAVPANPSLSVSELAKIYDDNAAKIYKNFTYSLQQIPCKASDSEKYSLASNCTDCAAAYKQWLCAVTIPRCQDFDSDLDFLLPRNTGQEFFNGTSLPDSDENRKYQQAVLTNSSRNPLIDTEIRPGPYREVLPCRELCYKLVQTCPSALGFACPTGEWLNASYGKLSENGDITCSYLGAAYFSRSGASRAITGAGVGMGILVVGLWSLIWGLGV